MKNMETGLDAFSELGLSKTEAAVLGSLITEGPATGTAIATRLGIQKSVAYFALAQVAHKGLVYFVAINKKREYRAVEPNVMKTIMENRRQEFSENFQQITRVLETVPKSRRQAEVKIFQDWDGMKKAFEEVLEAGPSGVVFAVSVPEKIFPRFRRFIRAFHRRRIEKKIPCRLLVSAKQRATIGADRKKEQSTQVRYVSLEQTLPMSVNVYGNKTMLAIWSSPPSAVIITGNDVADSFRAFFELMWARHSASNIAK